MVYRINPAHDRVQMAAPAWLKAGSPMSSRYRASGCDERLWHVRADDSLEPWIGRHVVYWEEPGHLREGDTHVVWYTIHLAYGGLLW